MTIDQMATEIAGLFPYYFKDQNRAESRLALYRRSLGHLRPEQLEQAYGEAMKAWSSDKPPMPKDILMHVRVSSFGAGTDGDGFNYRAMSEALPALIVEIQQTWRAACAGWCGGLIAEFERENTGHEQAAAQEVQTRITAVLGLRTHTHAQRVYRGWAAVRDFRLTDEDVTMLIGKPGPIDPVIIAIREGREPPRMSVRQLMRRKSKAA